MGQDPGGRRHMESGSVSAHRDASCYLVLVDPPGALGRRICPHLVERPAEVHGRRARRRERFVGGVDVVSSRRRERQAVRRGNADRGRAADGQRSDRSCQLSRIGERNHQSLANELIKRGGVEPRASRIRRRQRLGRLLNYYCRAA